MGDNAISPPLVSNPNDVAERNFLESLADPLNIHVLVVQGDSSDSHHTMPLHSLFSDEEGELHNVRSQMPLLLSVAPVYHGSENYNGDGCNTDGIDAESPQRSTSSSSFTYNYDVIWYLKYLKARWSRCVVAPQPQAFNLSITNALMSSPKSGFSCEETSEGILTLRYPLALYHLTWLLSGLPDPETNCIGDWSIIRLMRDPRWAVQLRNAYDSIYR